MERKIAETSLRIYGHIIDLMIILLSPIFILAVLGLGASNVGATVSHLQIGLAAAIYIFFTFAEGFGGRTPGKYFAKTRVVTTKGNQINLAQSLIRNVVRVVDILGFYILALIVMKFSHFRQRIGDHFAGTVVIYEGDDPDYDEANKMPTLQINYDAPPPIESDDDK
jgi:uncharacterized RDD family membrane protein YckC